MFKIVKGGMVPNEWGRKLVGLCKAGQKTLSSTASFG